VNKQILSVVLLTFTIVVMTIPSSTTAQDDDSKGIKAEVFINARPAKKAKKATSTARYHARQSSDAGDFTNASQVGVTIWRFRKSKASDKTKELVEEEDSGPSEWTLERVEEGTLLSPGQRVRLSIESLSRIGYLYVVDREAYADGSFGVPILIFPTQKTLEAGIIQPGRLAYIPSATGRLIIKPTSSTKPHVGEVLTIIVSSKPLVSNDEIGPQFLHLKTDTFDSWLKLWETKSRKLEMDGGAGQSMTQAELAAANANSSLLSQDDPVPQTIFQLLAKGDNPLLINVPLRFAKP